MFCSRCGTKLPDNAKSCSHCGLDLVPTTPVKAIASGEVTEADIVREALSAEYEIQEELGRGGMAIVYRARDRSLDRDVAIKVLPFSLAFDSEFVERFQREARTAAQLEHPNIIPIYRVGKAGRVTFFVMKFLRGQSLSHLLARRGRLPPPEIRRLLIESGSALGYAAKRGVVHRDIKPDNIMFDEHGVCMVADFGIAKAASGQKLTGTGMSIGTPHYMSPEQARAQNTDGRSDIYSLGVLGYQCLTGRVPYDGEDSFSIGYKHIMEPLPVPVLETPDERRLFEVIRRMLAKDPAERFQNCDELIATLEGQAVAPGGTLRGSGLIHQEARVEAARSSAPRPATPSVPTAPVPRVSPPAVAPPRGSVAGGRRPVARRSESSNAGVLIGMGALVVLGLGAAVWFGVLRPKAATGRDSTVNTTAISDSLSNLSDSATLALATRDTTADSTAAAGDTTAPAASTASSAQLDSTQVSSVQVNPADSGEIRLSGLPRGSRVLIDERPVTTSPIRISPGRHVLAISAPRYNFFADTIEVQPGAVLEMAPNLAPLGSTTTPTIPNRVQRRVQQRAAAPTCDEPVAGYNNDKSCYDQRPRPVQAPFVPLSAEVEGTPRPSVLLIKVSADGKTLQVRPFNPSNDAAFEKLARAYAATMEWHPATKSGTPVEGWTQMAFPPQQP
jgi:serine/threonine-protein kinase